MAKRTPNQASALKSWKEIAAYLHKPVTTVQRWAREGMPVKREGRYVVASPEELSRWIGEGSGETMHMVQPGEDLTAELKKAVTTARKQHRRIA
jgi:phage terminase Nu1 subunit (DNA packaging protein)